VSCCLLFLHESPPPVLQGRCVACSIPLPSSCQTDASSLSFTGRHFHALVAFGLQHHPRPRKLSGAGAELCLGLRGALKRKVSVLGELKKCWPQLEVSTVNSHGVQVILKGRRVFTSMVEGGNCSALSQSCDL